jgi:hypothetical protein
MNGMVSELCHGRAHGKRNDNAAEGDDYKSKVSMSAPIVEQGTCLAKQPLNM